MNVTSVDAAIDELLRQAKEKWAAMSPREQEAMLQAQRESWVRGEAGIGNDAREAAERCAYREQIAGATSAAKALAERIRAGALPKLDSRVYGATILTTVAGTPFFIVVAELPS